jgi:hypothetical protein
LSAVSAFQNVLVLTGAAFQMKRCCILLITNMCDLDDSENQLHRIFVKSIIEIDYGGYCAQEPSHVLWAIHLFQLGTISMFML